uniref:Uncharacterized protein n=1 Tax=Macaca fascicularis TaxID=9541 RepID=Q9GMS7_MACFA|nr:hypothetical protein [Macaca fascicularis]
MTSIRRSQNCSGIMYLRLCKSSFLKYIFRQEIFMDGSGCLSISYTTLCFGLFLFFNPLNTHFKLNCSPLWKKCIPKFTNLDSAYVDPV